ncbi:hypothetical protein DL771_003295 [Monosporascus sp. 5C6A]|nr:hypothetical protein DL771_003295 [Monosporascus sp. 5C6A]
MKITAVALLLPALTGLAAASISESNASAGTAAVILTKSIGEPKFLGSGFIYGWPDNGTSTDNSVPDYLVTGFKFNANRAGGAQIPAKGWATGGYEGYIGRFHSAFSNYQTTRKYGGEFILLPHDLWGADGGQASTSPYPGDDGNWTNMERFWNQTIKDLKANDMLDGLVVDIWNEPDIDIFWARPWTQYVEYYFGQFRAQLPGTLISGPSMAHSPTLDDANWQTWMASVSGNETAPDIYSWHQIGSWEGQPDTTVPIFNNLRLSYSLPEMPIEVNEYAWPTEQNPANAVYYLAQFERHNIRALRANWGSGPALHDYMANLVYKYDNGTYYPNGEWQLYKYYAGMTGTRVGTTASSDLLFDVFATVSGEGHAKIIAGTRTVQAAYDIKVSGLSSLGLPTNGTVDVRSYRFDWAGPEGEINAPVDLGCSKYTYSDDTKFKFPMDDT